MASGRFGRRPTLLLGPLGLTLAILGFGMSTRFWSLFSLVDFKAHLMETLVGIAKSIVGEVLVPTQPRLKSRTQAVHRITRHTASPVDEDALRDETRLVTAPPVDADALRDEPRLVTVDADALRDETRLVTAWRCY
ncbi:hypothetical protein F5887DRAFT_250915 [Amanita rubescens]|nr:hypothetical protein F5887DRAFT_250915 [Amanita rubescens]